MDRPVRILIADDHELVRRGMREIILSQPGWTVCGEATTGRQVLALALKLQPDLILLDLSLPEMNGIEVTIQLRRTTKVPILIVTMHESDEFALEAIEAGANGYVLKAEAGQTLAEAVRVVLSHGEFVSHHLHIVGDPAAAPGQARSRRRLAGPLTSREREVLQLLAEGQANKEIGSTLGITTKTAETHRARIMAKLDLHSITELVRYAIRNRIIEP